MKKTKVKSLEIEVRRPDVYDDKAFVAQVNILKKKVIETSDEMGVYLDDVYLDESTGQLVFKFEVMDGDDFVGQYRISAWMERLVVKYFTYEV
jgi:hypothetical protein